MNVWGDWEIRPQDVHWLGFELSFIVRDGWEPFGITAVPNSLDYNQIRLWTRRRSRRFWHRREYEVKVQSAGWGGHEVILHLTQGWEPFAMSESAGNPIVWFRRKV